MLIDRNVGRVSKELRSFYTVERRMSVMNPETGYLGDLGTPVSPGGGPPKAVFLPFVLVPNSEWGLLLIFPSDSS